MASKIIRDFIYMDVPWLYSLYSQMFEGVAEQIVRHTLDESAHENKVPGPEGERLETKVAEASLRTESSILYDHMYNRLEEQLQAAIELPNGLTVENYKEKLADSFLVKIKGKAEIEDYDRIKQFAGKFNTIAESIAYSSFSTLEPLKELQKQIPNMIQALEQSLQGKSKNQRHEINQKIGELKKLQDPDEFAKAAAAATGLRFDPKSLDYIIMWMDFFYPNGFEITIVPDTQAEKVVFRGILNKEFLRLKPDYLRAIYGGFVSTSWVMVGQVTYLPGTGIPEMETAPLQGEPTPPTPVPESQGDANKAKMVKDIQSPMIIDTAKLPIQNDAQREALASVTNTPSETSPMRDPFRNLFRQSVYFDRLFFESKYRVEALLRPLAIYQEIVMPSKQRDSKERA